MKNIVKYLSLLLISIFLSSFFATKTVSANYDTKKNYVTIQESGVGDSSNKSLKLKISVTYQKGFDLETFKYMICEKAANATISEPANCSENDIKVNLSFIGSNSGTVLSTKDSLAADENPMTKSYEVIVSNALIPVSSSKRENTYVVFVQTVFCSVRERDSNDPTKFTGCRVWHNSANESTSNSVAQFTRDEFKIDDVLKTNITDIGNEDAETVLSKISDIVYNTIMPIIWVILGLFLVIKGSMLGVQIVKAADEPQVRQEKLGSLKWLIIGCAITAAASGLVTVLTGFFSNAFDFS